MDRPSGRRNPFTEKDNEHLVKYIAKYKPEPHGRTGNNLYITLEENAGNQWPWSKNHSWQSWRERYKKNQVEFDHKIRQYQKRLIREKRRTEASPEKEEGGSPKAKKPIEQQPQVEGQSSKVTTKQAAQATLQEKKEGASNSAKTVRSKPAPQPSPQKVTAEQDEPNPSEDVEEATESLSDDLMHDLFGSFVEEEGEEEVEQPLPEQQPKSLREIYPDASNVPAPTLDTMEPHIPGGFEVRLQVLSQEPTPPKSGPEIHEALLKPTRPQLKKRKRKEEENPFETPSDTPPPVAHKTTATRQPPTIVEGPFRNTFKPDRAAGTANNNDGPAWPPKRRKKNNDAHVVAPQPEQHAVTRPRQSPRVNAVASSSKTRLPSSHTAHPVEGSSTDLAPTKDVVSSLISRSHAEQSLKPLGHDVLTRPTIGKGVIERRTLGDIPMVHHDEPSVGIQKSVQRGIPNPKETRTVAQRLTTDNVNAEVPSKSLSRNGSHNLPTRPTSDTDPFTAKHVSDKAAGKARADSYTIENKPPRRIDFHQESLSRRLRANTSLSSRRSSVLSSRTSTSSIAKKTTRRSSSFRLSIAALDLPDEERREFALVAAEDIAKIIEKLAKDHGVSTEIAMKTYMKTRSIDKTKFVLRQFFQTLAEMEVEIYTRMPDLNHVSEDEHDSDVPNGLVRQKSPEKDDSKRHRHSSASRKSNRPSLNVKPLVVVNDAISDYSPPNSSRAGQFARLVKQGRREEAIEREKHRASGQFFPQTQLGSANKRDVPPRDITITPTPHRDVPMEVDQGTEDEEMYVDYEQDQEADDESESGHPREDVGDQLRSVSGPQTLEQLISETHDQNPELALEHQMLALSVNAEDADMMRKFEARNDPDFLRLMSLRLVREIFDANAEDSDGEDDGN